MSAIFDPPYPIPYNPINGTVEAFEGTIRPVYNVLDYGADPTGVQDSTAAFQRVAQLLTAQGGVLYAPGEFLISDTIQFSGNGIYVQGQGVGWETGSGQPEVGSIMVASSSFPTGANFLQWNAPGGTTYNWGGVSKMAFICNSKADGIYAFNTYAFKAEELYIFQPWSSGVYCASPQNGSSVDSQLVRRVIVWEPQCNAKTVNGLGTSPAGIALADNLFQSTVALCYVTNSLGDAYSIGNAYGYGAYGVRVRNNTYDTPAGIGIHVALGNYCDVIGNKGYGVPGAAGIVYAGSTGAMIAHNLCPGSNSTGQAGPNGAVMHLAFASGIVSDNVIAGGPNSTYGIYMDSAVGSPTLISGNTFAGTFSDGPIGFASAAGIAIRNNPGYNPVGPTAVAVPASGSATTALPYDATFYITQATAASSVAVQGQSIAIPVGGPTAIRVPAGQTLTPTYTTAPTWVVMGD